VSVLTPAAGAAALSAASSGDSTTA
jgi:hypothetical protein